MWSLSSRHSCYKHSKWMSPSHSFWLFSASKLCIRGLCCDTTFILWVQFLLFSRRALVCKVILHTILIQETGIPKVSTSEYQVWLLGAHQFYLHKRRTPARLLLHFQLVQEPIICIMKRRLQTFTESFSLEWEWASNGKCSQKQ